MRASFAHTEHRTSPALGGASVLRESIPMPGDIFDAAVRLVKALGLQGLCGVEFRRNASNQPLLMEINARLAGEIETALVSGADFPLMTWQWATGQRVEQSAGVPDRGPDALAARRHALAAGQPPAARTAGQPAPRPGAVHVRRRVRPAAPLRLLGPARPAPGPGRDSHYRGGHPQQQTEPAAPGNQIPPEGSSPCQLTRS